MNIVEEMTAETTGLGASMTRSALEAWQLEKVRGVLSYAAQNSAFYSERLVIVKPENIRSITDLDRIPFTAASDVGKAPRAFLCVPQKEVARAASLRTSGTTAPSKRIFFTQGDMERTVRFFSRGMLPIVGGGKSVLIMMSNSTPDSVAALLRRGLEASGIAARIHGHIADADFAAREAARFDCLVGVPAEMLYLCRTYPHLRPKSVLLSADYVSERLIAAIRETWRCRVYTHYGMTETCYGCAVQTEENALHRVRHEDMLIEIIDPRTGTRLADGRSGEVVITTFANRAMPLIRYRTGDISALGTDTTSADALPGLTRIFGRLGNALSLGGGVTISVERLDDLIYGINDVKAYRAVLKKGAGLRVEVDCALEKTADSVRKELLAEFGGVSVRVERAALPPSVGTGKRKIIVEEEDKCSAISAKMR